ncbi:ATP-binding protein [Streptomyces sp. SBT349]|uniref:ATP-binding protein n=1 Tax=Streptomyces sp. SBT349 TaxID=1580539 RepID=UPI00066CB8D0|nr:ATP-binding protein [Streptomyces sp. SBT349]
MTATSTPEPRVSSWWDRFLTVRSRLLAVAVMAITALVVLVAVNASRDWGQQRSLHNDSRTGELGGEASLGLFTGAQVERTLTAAYLVDPTSEVRAALEEQRGRTDQGIDSFTHLSGSELQVEHRHKWEYVERVYDELDGLDDVRRQADARSGDPDEITGYYTDLLARLIEFYQALSAMDDPELTLETRPLVGLFWASEGLAQEAALIAQARAAGGMSAEHREDFAAAYGSQRVMYERWIAPYLPAQDGETYERILASEAWETKERVELALISAPTSQPDGSLEELPAELETWDAAYAEVAERIGRLNLSRTQGLLAHGYQRADEVRAQALWQFFGGLGAVVVIAGLIVWLIVSIAARLREVRLQTEEGTRRLPAVVERLMNGERVDPQLEFPDPRVVDEFGHVQRALVVAQRTAVEQAARQAADRRGFNVFVSSTTARTLGLVSRSLDLLHRLMKKHEKHPGLVEELIELDGPVVATRRHQENLAALTGTGRQEPYTEPKALLDLVNDAAVETGQPQRINNRIAAGFLVAPDKVNSVIHMIAALLDNALANSNDDVTVTSRTAVHGIALEIEDLGWGMPAAQYAEVNDALAKSSSFEAMAHKDGRLGLFVVSQYACRHRMRVELRPSVYNGTTAVVLLTDDVKHRGDSASSPSRVVPNSAVPAAAPGPVPPLSHPPVAADAGVSAPPLPRRSGTEPTPPQPELRMPVAPRHAAALPERTDPGAPALPRRTPRAAPARAVTQPSPSSSGRVAADGMSPEQVGAAWGPFTRGPAPVRSPTMKRRKKTTSEAQPRDPKAAGQARRRDRRRAQRRDRQRGRTAPVLDRP